ncbi:hypothetical protein QR680_018147 [Steinernema hermaphroditum]|uniref:Uncharacterized protein n=1 Tax=Steinernema hermaphroditum TaxID=289476 RepID=A0AA39HJ83_9BILA|nr:hypothetical protein QR680_018147 [Steinernema hermaphroditum]
MSREQPSTSEATPMQQKTAKKRQPMASDANHRINFLHQAASRLAESTDSQSSSAAKLARMYLSDMNEVCFIGMTRVDRAIRRSYCKKCKQPWTGTQEGLPSFKLKLAKNRRLRQICRNCAAEKSYPVNRDYQSRNEQHQGGNKGSGTWDCNSKINN